MLVPWLAALGIEWMVLTRAFAGELEAPARSPGAPPRGGRPRPPQFAAGVLGATLIGFGLSSVAGIAPVWIAAAAAAVMTARVRPSPLALVRAAEPSFLIFVLALAVGPNLTYVGSLATLLWRRIVHAHDETVDVKEFVRLGVLTVTPVLLASTVALWLALHVV